MDEKIITIKIEGDGITFEDKISKTLVPQIISLCISEQQRKNNNPFDNLFWTGASNSLPKNTRESVVEYIQRQNTKSNFEKILSFAGYIKDVQGREVFYPNEVKSLFRDAREILPANFTRDFNTVIGNGWIHKDTENPDGYYITQTGQKALGSGFSDISTKKTKQLKKKKIKGTSGKKLEEYNSRQL
jgi:hypothetical protein